MIHRAIFGSFERFFGILIEHYGGAFPFWLAPVQVKILTVSEEQFDYSNFLVDIFSKLKIRVEIDKRNEKLSDNVKNLYLKGKIFELLGLFFNESNELNIEQCPFLADEKNVVKIKMAKEIIIKRMSDPPSLKELSTEVDISLKNLKEGFKEIYGFTVYGFLMLPRLKDASILKI